MKLAQTIWMHVEGQRTRKRVCRGKVEEQDFNQKQIYSNMTLNPTIYSKLFELPKTQKEENAKAPATEKAPVALPPVIAKHDFTNLQRLASALENFNYPENT